MGHDLGDYRGYVRVDLTPESWETTVRVVSDPNDRDATVQTLARFAVEDGRPGAQPVS